MATEPIAIIGEAVAGNAAKLRKEMMIMVEDIKERTFDLAVSLYRAKHDGLYRQWGYSSISDYGETELGLRESKTFYLVRIVEVMIACGIFRSEYEPVGVSKLREIKRLDPESEFFNGEALEPMKDHIRRLVKEAPQMTGAKLKLEVDRLLGMTGGNRMVLKTMAFTEDAWKKIEEAVEVVRKQLGSKGRTSEGLAEEYPIGKCMELICGDFLADPNNDPDQDIELQSEPDTENVLGDIPTEPTI